MVFKVNDNLFIDSELLLSEIIYFHIHWEVNDHCHIIVKGSMTYTAAVGCQNNTFLEKHIAVKLHDKILFNGVIKKIEFSFPGKTAEVIIQGISASWLMDKCLKNQSYQNVEMSYSDLAKRIAEKNKASIITTCGKNIKLIKPYIQYKETDWAFVKRLASNLNQPILSDVETGKPAFWFGLKQGKPVGEIHGQFYDIKMDLIKSSISYVVNCNELYQVGDRFLFLKRVVVVCDRVIEFANGELSFIYTITHEANLEPPIFYNENISGLGVLGKVCRVEGEKVALNLELDHEEGSGLYLYPWRPATGNIMYSMPEVGSTVVLTLLSRDDREGMVTACLHSQKVDRKTNYGNRVFKTAYNAKIKLYPNRLELSNKENKVSIQEPDNLTVASNKEILIESDNQIRLKAGIIVVKSPDEIKGITG